MHDLMFSRRSVCRATALAVTGLVGVVFLAMRCDAAGEQSSDDAPPLAWVRFAHAADVYADQPYLWLGHGDVKLVIEVKPRAGQELELFWGAKNDTRHAEVIVNGRPTNVQEGGYDGFRWLKVPMPDGLEGDRYEVVLRRDSRPAAFLAAVRLVGTNGGEGGNADPKQPAHRITYSRDFTFNATEAFPEMRPLWDRQPPERAVQPGESQREALFARAERNGRRAAEAFYRSRRFIDGWLAHADPVTGLIPRNLDADADIWNARDSAADNYPFMVVTAAMTDQELFEGRMRKMLDTETRLTCRIDRLPDTWSFSKQDFADAEPDLARIIFGGSEYVKDGLLAVTEWLGESPWSKRMIGIVDDIWKHAPVETPRGKIPSTNPEVNGEMLQVLSRVYWMTGDQKYLEWALRLGDYYLLDGHDPTRSSGKVTLIAHGGEVFSGLAELYVTVAHAMPEKREAYKAPLHAIFDRILEIGRNEHGMIWRSINGETGEHSPQICDTWGYTYNGVYAVFMIDGNEPYREAVRKPLSFLNEHYRNSLWGRRTVVADEYADSIEGAINLMNREPTPTVDDWLDSEIRVMWALQLPDGVIEGWHGDGNYARTSLMYALWKTQGLTIRPWRADIRFGAVRAGRTLYASVTADEPWEGELVFDKARHRENLHLPIDYPRLNQFPEWFTTEKGTNYTIRNVTSGTEAPQTGEELQSGMPVQLPGGIELRLVLTPVEG